MALRVSKDSHEGDSHEGDSDEGDSLEADSDEGIAGHAVEQARDA
ncbi:MAG: hypothetical protein ACK52S_13350 [Pirellula sp.]